MNEKEWQSHAIILREDFALAMAQIKKKHLKDKHEIEE